MADGEIKQPQTGLVHMSRASYDALTDRANYSRIKKFARSPAHFMCDDDGEDTDARKLGRVAHLAVFEPHLMADEVVTWEGGRRSGNDWKDFATLHAGKEILTVDEAQHVKAIAAAVRNHPVLARYLEKGGAEVTALWTDAETGVACKARLDWISASGVVVDLKTCRDASPEAFVRQSNSLLYHAQAAMYSDAVHAIAGDRLPFLFGAVESKAPFIAQPYVVSDDALNAGRALYRGWLRQLVECKRANRWPGYSDGVLTLELPRWADPGREFANE